MLCLSKFSFFYCCGDAHVVLGVLLFYYSTSTYVPLLLLCLLFVYPSLRFIFCFPFLFFLYSVLDFMIPFPVLHVLLLNLHLCSFIIIIIMVIICLPFLRLLLYAFISVFHFSFFLSRSCGYDSFLRVACVAILSFNLHLCSFIIIMVIICLSFLPCGAIFRFPFLFFSYSVLVVMIPFLCCMCCYFIIQPSLMSLLYYYGYYSICLAFLTLHFRFPFCFSSYPVLVAVILIPFPVQTTLLLVGV